MESETERGQWEVVLEGYRRTHAYWAENSGVPPFDAVEATPPGVLDLRVLDQTDVWVDILRQVHVITDRDNLTDAHLANVIGWLIAFKNSLAAGWARMHHQPRRPKDIAVWLETTALMVALRAEAEARGITDRVHPPLAGTREL